jgi:hypothetical protein
MEIKPGQVWKRNGPDVYVRVKEVINDVAHVLYQRCQMDGTPLASTKTISTVAEFYKRYVFIREGE